MVVPAQGSELSAEQVVQAFLGSIGDLDAAMEYVADDILYENIGTFPLPAMRSRRATRRFLGVIFKLGLGIAIEVHAIAADGPIVLTERTDSVIFGETPASFWVCGRFEVRDGRIVHWRDYYDNGAILIAFSKALLRAGLAKLTRS